LRTKGRGREQNKPLTANYAFLSLVINIRVMGNKWAWVKNIFSFLLAQIKL
jgi:hypothetical protein